MTIDLTENEWQFVQVLREMKPQDQMLITKKSPKSDTEFEVRTGQVMYLFRAEIRQSIPPP
mgnify:CR=1 FL=1